MPITKSPVNPGLKPVVPVATGTAQKSTCRTTPCPTCGGATTFERPRYFSGQLLTDQDLDLSQRYVIEKNRLHNRYLVGTGVVCGLAVRCDSCDGFVDIDAGYAIDCCGNDIIVGESTPFNVIEYVNTCLATTDPGCGDKIKPRPKRCDDVEKEYCLTISYSEAPSRPMTVLGRDAGCASGRCEPSRTDETFRFDLSEKSAKSNQPGGMVGKMIACVSSIYPRLVQFMKELAAAGQLLNQNPRGYYDAVFAIYCQMADMVRELNKNGPYVRCALDDELDGEIDNFPAYIEDPAKQQEQLRLMFRELQQMFSRVLQGLIDCLCDATLVPCPQCSGEDEGVLLACITVKGGQIVKICNTVRTQVVTGPALQYWLQPLYALLSQLFEMLCYELDPSLMTRFMMGRGVTSFDNLTTAFNRSAATVNMGTEFVRNLGQTLRNVNFVDFTSAHNVVTPEVFNRSAADVRTELEKKGVQVVETQAATNAEAYSVANLGKMAWSVQPGSRVELVLDPNGKVAGLRTLQKEG